MVLRIVAIVIELTGNPCARKRNAMLTGGTRAMETNSAFGWMDSRQQSEQRQQKFHPGGKGIFPSRGRGAGAIRAARTVRLPFHQSAKELQIGHLHPVGAAMRKDG